MNRFLFPVQRCRGQAILELAVIVFTFAAFLVCIVLIGITGQASIQSTAHARLAAFDCDVRPQHCRSSSIATQQKTRSNLLGGDHQEVFAFDLQSQPKNFLSAQKHSSVIAKVEDLRLDVDLPRIDGADKGLLSKLADAFRSFAAQAGPLIFGLPSPDQLTRVRFEQNLWGISGLSLPGAPAVRVAPVSQVAMVVDSWAAQDRIEFLKTVQKGESPSALSDAVTLGFYALAKDGLMPVLDLVGLESSTRSFREAFRNIDHDVVYGNARTQNSLGR